MKKICLLLATLPACTTFVRSQKPAPAATTAAFSSAREFWQEYHEPFPVAAGEAGAVRGIAVDRVGTVFIATPAGAFRKTEGSAEWRALPFSETDKGPAFTTAVDDQDVAWIGSWSGVFRYAHDSLTQIPGTSGPVSVLCRSREGLYALGPRGVWLFDGKIFREKKYPVARSVRGAVSDGKGGLWIASDVGLFHARERGTSHLHQTSLLISAGLKGAAFAPNGALWVAGLGGISVLRGESKEKFITPREGCPSIYTNCIATDAEGTVWVGTQVGVVRFYPNGDHSLRFSRRWLLDDQVNAVAFGPDGTAWVATQQGVSAIRRKKMSLASKEEYFYRVLMARHMREPWIAAQVHLLAPGDTTRWQPEDDDNDGEYTGNYLAMESFRYAATRDADARQKAAKAFHFLKEEQDITGGDGYFARTIVPIDWADRVHDNNRPYTPAEIAEELVKDPRYKPVETRWHKSADGKRLWKGDASSDEWCGHMMGYYCYYELAADEDEKKLIRAHVAALVDHLIAHDFTMTDVDGTHTHWAVWSPALLNHDPEWTPDRSHNSLELLAFLKLAAHVTGDAKYENQYRRLIREEHYLDNMTQIVNQNPAWFIYFDAPMQAYLYPILLHCEKDPKLLSFYRNNIDTWMANRKADGNPLINFLYCWATGKRVELPASLTFLRNTPLDLVDWHIDHTKREDVRMVHTPVLDEWQVSELPDASIRSTVRWDNNPWRAVNGSNDTEREPVFWLYPYWMGRYLKMIP